MIDGGAPDHGTSGSCFSPTYPGQEAVFGAGIVNESDGDITITDVSVLAQNTVHISEIALAGPGDDDLGWGVSIADDIWPTMRDAWESRIDPIGATVAPGERVWILIVARTAGTLDQRTGMRGVRVEYDGALWPRSTQNDNVYGFGPFGSECDAGMEPRSH
ncbi:MAG: hypothetical protein KIT89_13335 [Microcella sp.]|uniref:hypothetical protein n=1 Tax=Microcella sp. TaxID=1913979 RepID=UPI0024C7805E|nr:hypothetical protein [Microcella sp.]UYN83634.1 MAG: hypothetical protein KIT89_13335 [Microcella sp.]